MGGKDVAGLFLNCKQNYEKGSWGRFKPPVGPGKSPGRGWVGCGLMDFSIKIL